MTAYWLEDDDADLRAQTLAELAQRSSIPRSRALRLARSLMEVGALERLDDGRFVAGEVSAG
ncbi:helix-turn-helix domain-containing protein [Streptomyces sp. NPDC096040]|uniref:helix-turn-helix domain-containing protein n=1 Tax=Streptomyces sp. NPDC096040 TaxID=3155541 RepID=UPI0033296E46